jgi:hypothetical protein
MKRRKIMSISTIFGKVFTFQYFFITACFLSIIYGCKTKENRLRSGEEAMISTLGDLVTDIDFFDETCRLSFEKAFIKYGVWPENSELDNAARLELSKPILLNESKDYSVFGFLYSFDTISMVEVYLYDKIWNDFTPIHFKEGYFEKDTMCMVKVYFDDILECSGVEIKGNIYSGPKRNGVFKKVPKDEW